MLTVNLPYFNRIIELLESHPEKSVIQDIYRNVHCGYFEEARVDEPLAAYPDAGRELTRRICAAGTVKDGQRIVDIGCGFGGAIHHLNEHLTGCNLVGVNVDRRQLDYAREWTSPRNGNTITFIEADACAVPLREATFDVVLAIECIFHFPSRDDFFREAARLLSASGRVAISDFTVNPDGIERSLRALVEGAPALLQFFGSVPSPPVTVQANEQHARSAGLRLRDSTDVTLNTSPTYPAIRDFYREVGWADGGEAAIDFLEDMSARGLFHYHIMSFGHGSMPVSSPSQT